MGMGALSKIFKITPENKPIFIWWMMIYLTLVLLIGLGGITRLTHSGLSIVEWKPITGILPPLAQETWENEFEKYKFYPEFQKVQTEITLKKFKKIYLWEYFHRLAARSVGLIILFPALFFWFQKKISRSLFKKALGVFGLVAAQGVLGWFMVLSGLVKNPQVSHFRLAAHFMMAIFITHVVWWIIMMEFFPKENKDSAISRLSKWAWGLTGLLGLQLLYGAFVAGLKAGFGYNTWPKMGTEWVPDALFLMEGFWQNILSNPFMVQFIHRWLPFVLLIYLAVFSMQFFKAKPKKLTKRVMIVFHSLILVQIVLGILTLVMKVPIHLGVTHQIVAIFLVTTSISLNFLLTERN